MMEAPLPVERRRSSPAFTELRKSVKWTIAVVVASALVAACCGGTAARAAKPSASDGPVFKYRNTLPGLMASAPIDLIQTIFAFAPGTASAVHTHPSPSCAEISTQQINQHKGAEMKSKLLAAFLICDLSAGVFAPNAQATPSSGVTTTILAKSLFDKFAVNTHSLPADGWQARLKTRGQSDAYVVDNKLAPGATTGWHSHPGPSLIFVVAGTVTNYTNEHGSCTGAAYSAGSGFIDPGGEDAHNLRNESATTQAETIAVQLLPTGAARRIDEPQPTDCNPVAHDVARGVH